MPSTQSDYHSFMLRLWRVQEDGHQWRASLEDVQTGELHGFQNLTELLSYLEELAFTKRRGEVAVTLQLD